MLNSTNTNQLTNEEDFYSNKEKLKIEGSKTLPNRPKSKIYKHKFNGMLKKISLQHTCVIF